jgi:MFS family permease
VKKFPGWRVVTAVFVMLMTTSGLGFYGLSVYLEAISDLRGFSVSSVSGATTLFFLAGGIIGVFVARLIARYDPRPVVCGGAVVGGTALALLGRAEQIWQVYLLYAFFAVGFSAAGLVPGTTVVTRWFHRRRSVALSVASTGLSVGGLVITPLVSRFIDRHGFEAVTPWLGLAFVAGVVPISLLLLRPDPVKLGFLPDGDAAPPAGTPNLGPQGTPFAEAVKSRFFLFVAVGFVLVMAAQVGGLAHIFTLVSERQDRELAALMILVIAGSSVVFRLAGGVLINKVPMIPTTAALAATQGLALAFISQVSARPALLLGALVFGATVGNLLMLQPLLTAERFGVRDYPRIYSRMQLVSTLGVAGGPLLIGTVHDVAGGYEVAFLVATAASVLGAISMANAKTARAPEPALAT